MSASEPLCPKGHYATAGRHKSMIMIGKMKKWLGIEGVKLEIQVSDDVSASGGTVRGMLRLQSMNTQTVTQIKLLLIETYSRGRGESRITDEYLMGSLVLDDIFDVPPETLVERPFILHFAELKSDVDSFGDKNLLYNGLARLARLTRAVKSEYRLEAEARVRGVALNPFDRKAINIT